MNSVVLLGLHMVGRSYLDHPVEELLFLGVYRVCRGKLVCSVGLCVGDRVTQRFLAMFNDRVDNRALRLSNDKILEGK